MYTGTPAKMPANGELIFNPLNNSLQGCPDHHQFGIPLINLRLTVSQVQLTYSDTENKNMTDMVSLSYSFADCICKPLQQRLL